jgi:hypothetical protein
MCARVRRGAPIGALLAVFLTCCRLPAQAIPDRTALQLFRDSLDVSQDTVVLHRLEAQTIALARTRRDDPLLHLRLGFVALRIHALGGNVQRIDDAASEFEWAAELQPGWPYPWYGLGLAESREPDRVRGFGGGLWTMLGIDRDTRAGAAFARAIKADPRFTESLIAFAETARSQRIGAPVVAALDAIRLAQMSPLGWDPALLLERGRLERLAGNADSARVAFRRAQLLALNPAMATLELARTLPLSADTLPARRGQPLPVEIAYYRAAASEDREVVAMYRRDLQPIVHDSTLAQFDLAHGDARVAWLRDFWRKRAAVDLRTAGARLSEHFRRWDYATRNFRLPPFKRSYRWGIETWQSHDPDLDDRGVIWLRQGAPTTRIAWPRSQPRQPLRQPSPLAPAAPVPGSLILNPPVGETPSYGNETWRYARPDGDIMLHFAAQDDPDDYRLVESILELDVAFDAMLDRAADLPGVAELLRSGPLARAGRVQEDRLSGKRSIGTATTTTAWPRSYSIILGGRAQWLVAGVRDGTPLVHIVVGIDAEWLRVLQADRRTGLIPITVRAVFLDGHGNPVASLDTVEWLRRPGAEAALVATRAEVPVPPGTHQMRLNVEANRAIGAVYPLDTLGVPDIHAGKLTASSVLLGVAGRSLPWAPVGGDTVWLGVQNRYTARDTVAVYFEAIGVHPETSYTVHLGLTRQHGPIARLLAGHREAVTVTERLTFPGEIGVVRRAIALRGLQPGDYQLDVVIEGGGERVARRRVFVIQ